MKKALIVLLILAVAGGLFAQSWSGSVNTGAKFTFADDMPVNADDDDGHAVKGRLSFTNSGDDWGVNIGVNGDVTKDDDEGKHAATINIGDMNGWVKFANMFKLTAGKGIDGAWGSGGNTDTNISGSDAGVRLEITPIDGLNFGFRFGYPNGGVQAKKVANFFQEIGIGAKYSADVWWFALGLDLDSEETTGDGLDGLFYFGFNFSGLSLFNIHVGSRVENAFTDGRTVKLFEKFDGSVAGLNWYLEANEKLIPDPLAVGLKVGLSYGITISDPASAEIGASAEASYADEFSFDKWDIYAKVTYKFNGNVSTTAKLDIAGTVDPSKITPSLLWTIGYSF